MEEQLPFESELIARLGWLIRLRWLAVVGTTAAFGLLALWFPAVPTLGALFAVTAAIAAYNLLFYLYFRSLRFDRSGAARLRHAMRFACTQIALDMVALAALLHFAGGVENPLVLFFVFHVIIASILLPRGVSYLMAGLATGLNALVLILEYTGLLSHYHLPVLALELYREPLYLVVWIAAVAFTLFMVVYLTTSITTRLRERDRELWESNLTCQIRSGELEELNEELRRIDGERTRFMVLVTHELRAPISTIYSALDLVLSGLASPEKARDILVRAQIRADELLALIGELLDLTRIREEPPRPEEATLVQVEEILQEVVDFVQVEADEKKLALRVEIAPRLAPVRTVPDQIKLVWTNLLSNAIKYNEPGGSIEVSLTQDRSFVVGTVRDTGIGIAPEDLTNVFAEFFRAKNARRVSSHGTGVGLAIVRRIVENWGGQISVESELGSGTRFTFTLPKAK